MDISIIIPCYDEEDNVPQIATKLFPVVEELRRTHHVEILFIDDGSADTTYQELLKITANQENMRIVRHLSNRGLGEAQRTGFKNARGEIIVTTDSDGTYDFAEIPALLALLKPDIDIVTASPYGKHGRVENVPAYRIILSRGASAIYQLLLDRSITAYTCLFRAYRRDVVRNVPFESSGFLAGTQLLVNAVFMGYKVAEHPSTLHVREIGASKARMLRTIRTHLRFQWSVLLRRLRLAPIPTPLERKITL